MSICYYEEMTVSAGSYNQGYHLAVFFWASEPTWHNETTRQRGALGLLLQTPRPCGPELSSSSLLAATLGEESMAG
jgi:hypothetical protein